MNTRQKGTQVNRTEHARRHLLRRGGFLASSRGGGSGAGFWGGTAVLRLVGLLALAIAALLALGAASASAATTRQLESQITEADGAPFAEPTAVAVDSADDLWVTDPGYVVIDKFDSLGAPA
jgi:hypothetical protein